MIAYWIDLVHDAGRSLTAIMALTFAGWVSTGGPIFAQSMPTGSDTFVEFALRQGGALAVLLIVLFYYRRDYRDLTDYRSARDQILVDLVREQAKAITEMSGAVRENTAIVQAIFQDRVERHNAGLGIPQAS